MAKTLGNLEKRLDQLEKAVKDTNVQLSWVVDELLSEAPENFKTGAEVMAYYRKDKKEGAKIFREVLEKMGIADVEPIPIEQLQARMVRNGIRSEDNEFSRAIIAEREK